MCNQKYKQIQYLSIITFQISHTKSTYIYHFPIRCIPFTYHSLLQYRLFNYPSRPSSSKRKKNLIKCFGSTTPWQKADPLNIPPTTFSQRARIESGNSGSSVRLAWALSHTSLILKVRKGSYAVNLQALKLQFKMYVGFSKKIPAKNGHVAEACFACTKPFAESMFELRRHITTLHWHHSHEGDVFKWFQMYSKCSGCSSKTQTIRSISNFQMEPNQINPCQFGRIPSCSSFLLWISVSSGNVFSKLS